MKKKTIIFLIIQLLLVNIVLTSCNISLEKPYTFDNANKSNANFICLKYDQSFFNEISNVIEDGINNDSLKDKIKKSIKLFLMQLEKN